MKSLFSVSILCLVVSQLHAEKIIGEYVFRVHDNGRYDFFDAQLSEGDLITVRFGYDVDAEPRPILEQFEPEPLDYDRIFTASYDLDFFNVEIGENVTDFPDSTLSIRDSLIPTSSGDGFNHQDELYLSSNQLDFYVLAFSSGSHDALTTDGRIPDEVTDFPCLDPATGFGCEIGVPILGGFLHPEPNVAHASISLAIQTVPEPEHLQYLLVVCVFLSHFRRGRRRQSDQGSSFTLLFSNN